MAAGAFDLGFGGFRRIRRAKNTNLDIKLLIRFYASYDRLFVREGKWESRRASKNGGLLKRLEGVSDVTEKNFGGGVSGVTIKNSPQKKAPAAVNTQARRGAPPHANNNN
ncbi:hypothetical protein EVAR_96671_1 [Eumeta japonica]|uniref:Uncharacterized protein n=1 Tax=Eumeta variegata TaxID=151549 RepID=A0A4C1WJZ9_EUMVA|nr:hypothetical protein EVAR_96671_1 [Eumeta japonica]